MDTTYPRPRKSDEARTGTFLSIAGLLAWLTAMLLALAGPLLGKPVPPLVIVAIIIVSAVFTVLSLPRLNTAARSSRDRRAPRKR
jgi:hypothetical protein